MKLDQKISLSAVESIKKHPKLLPFVKWGNRVLTYFNILCYPALLVYYIVTKDPMLARAIIVPMDGFIILSVARFFINRKRPYETLDFDPVIPKKTKGKSFPSRHVFSAMMIGLTFLLWSPFFWVGIASIAISLIIAAIRVFTGVHYPTDVAAGLLFAILCGVLGYLVF